MARSALILRRLRWRKTVADLPHNCCARHKARHPEAVGAHVPMWANHEGSAFAFNMHWDRARDLLFESQHPAFFDHIEPCSTSQPYFQSRSTQEL
ncbi:MAG TPA: hypothetical protein VFB23_13065 [Candidatus Acidoferrales bacterium]|nr:hypothetical protein [Candidatus Acidoferrales bacterium]